MVGLINRNFRFNKRRQYSLSSRYVKTFLAQKGIFFGPGGRGGGSYPQIGRFASTFIRRRVFPSKNEGPRSDKKKLIEERGPDQW